MLKAKQDDTAIKKKKKKNLPKTSQLHSVTYDEYWCDLQKKNTSKLNMRPKADFNVSDQYTG